MDLGGDPFADATAKEHSDRWMANANAARAAREAGRKPFFARLRERLRPHRQEPRGDPASLYGPPGDPGR